MTKEGDRGVATWQPWGPGLQSIEDLSTSTAGGYLGVDYADGVDTRWNGIACLSPLITDVDCSAAGGTTANANGIALSNGMNATKYIYVTRGTKWVKLGAAGITVVSDGTETALGEAATGILYTKNVAGTEEISVFMAGTAYRVITAVSALATDTHSANASAAKIRIGAKASPADTYAMLGLTGAIENTIYHNVLTGTTTMVTPNLVTRATLTDSIQFTGFGMSDNTWIVGTNDGPYYLDNDFQRFKPMLPELDLSTNHCVQADTWRYLGLIIPLANGVMAVRNEGRTIEFIGPDKFPFNTSPVTGRATGVAGTQRWLYLPILNAVTGDTWLCAVRPRMAGEYGTGTLPAYFPLAKRASTTVGFISNIGTYGGRTLPTLVMGNGSNVSWFSEGRTDRFPDDTSYTYSASGSLYLTEMRREPHWWKEIDYIEFETANCTATETITVKISLDGGTATQLGAVINSNGMQRIRLPQPEEWRGRRVKLQFDFARGGTTTLSPQIVGTVRVGYHYRTLLVDGLAVEE